MTTGPVESTSTAPLGAEMSQKLKPAPRRNVVSVTPTVTPPSADEIRGRALAAWAPLALICVTATTSVSLPEPVVSTPRGVTRDGSPVRMNESQWMVIDAAAAVVCTVPSIRTTPVTRIVTAPWYVITALAVSV